MGRFYVENTGVNIIIRYNGDLFEKFNKDEITYFDRALIRGILKPVKKGFKVMEYQVPAGTQLQQYIKKGINKNDFKNIILQALNAIKRIEENGLNVNNLRLETDTTFVNENTGDAYFAYLPAKSPNRAINIGTFISNLAYSAVFVPDTDVNFANDIVRFIGGKATLTLKEVEEYINNTNGIMRFHNDDCFDDEGTVLLDDEATVFLDEDDGTVLLEDEPQTHIYIMRVKTCEETEIKTPSFIIGKDESKADLAITDNNAISRVHMELTCIEGRYFVRDNNSTNGTYVNEIRLEKGATAEIVDGDEIRLANEDFEFHVETTI